MFDISSLIKSVANNLNFLSKQVQSEQNIYNKATGKNTKSSAKTAQRSATMQNGRMLGTQKRG